MSRQKNKTIATSKRLKALIVSTAASCLTLSASVALAVELGHSRVTSAPGKPLVVVVTLKSIAGGESVAVTLASAPSWQASGLKPPVALDSLKVTLLPPTKPGTRAVEIRSPQASDLSVIDLLLSVKTASADRLLQTSVIVPPPPKVRLAGETVTVQRGDTLIGIAEQFPVAGADLYQQLWALYSANPKAFFEENMNLLKAGASLRIPDADAVRAVDPRFAKAQYLAHVRAFRQRTSGGQGNQGISGTTAPETLKAPEVQQGKVEAPRKIEPVAPANNQVRLSSVTGTNAAPGSPQAQAAAQAIAQDQQTSEAKARAEELARKEALEQNVKALQGALAAGGVGATADGAGGSSGQRGDGASSVGSSASGLSTGASSGSVSGGNDGATSGAASGAASGATSGAASGATSGATSGAASGTTSGSTSGAEGSKPEATASLGQSASGSATAQGPTSGVDASTGGSSEAPGGKSGDVSSKTASSTSSSAGDGPANLSKDPIARLGQWVGDNTMAAIAILLALIALILAWALRSNKSKAQASSGVSAAVAAPAAAFEKQLKEIDLSLDEPSPVGAVAASEAKPDTKA